MNLKLKIWRQKDPNSRGKFVNYQIKDISSDSSFLEMLDVLLFYVSHGGRMIRLDAIAYLWK